MTTKKTVLLIAFTALSCLCYSQRYENSSNVNGALLIGEHLGATVEYEKLFNRSNSFFLNATGISIKKEFNDLNTKAKLFDAFIATGYRKYFNISSSARENTIYPYIGVGVLVGYEFISNKNDFTGTVQYNRGNEMIYGGISDLGVEYYMKKTSLFISFSPTYEINNKDVYLNLKLGVKFHIL